MACETMRVKLNYLVLGLRPLQDVPRAVVKSLRASLQSDSRRKLAKFQLPTTESPRSYLQLFERPL